MKEIYRQRIQELISGVAGKITLLERMTDGTKKANTEEARQYMIDIKKGMQKISDFVSIS